MSDAEAAINARIDTFVALLRDRDPALVDELWTERGFRLVGSEKGEVFETRDALAGKVASIFANPRRISFDWPRRAITREGDVAWAFVEGDIVYSDDAGEARKAYSATFVFQILDGEWRWRQFFGSEPY